MPEQVEPTPMSDNELIAEFMGQHVTPVGLRRNVMQKSYYADELKYDTSFDWLIPVVEKINTVYQGSILEDREGQWSFEKVLNTRVNCELKFLYKAVLEFIKWHNSQPHKL